MKEQRNKIALLQVLPGLRATIFAFVTMLLSLGGLSYCLNPDSALSSSNGPALSSSQDISLLLEQIPAQGGTVTPDIGIHHLSPNSEVTLTANPKPGYQFVCWLGDVSDPKSNTTVAYINGPKIIIALFERNDGEDLLPMVNSSGGGGGGGSTGLAGGGSTADYANPSGLMSGGGKSVKPKIFSPEPQIIPWSNDLENPSTFLAPVEEDPVVPEPATGILLALGSLLTLTRYRAKKRTR